RELFESGGDLSIDLRMRSKSLRRRGRRIVNFLDLRADALLRLEFERRLEDVDVEPGCRVQTGEDLRVGDTLKALVPNEVPDHRAVLLLDPGLIILLAR